MSSRDDSGPETCRETTSLNDIRTPQYVDVNSHTSLDETDLTKREERSRSPVVKVDNADPCSDGQTQAFSSASIEAASANDIKASVPVSSFPPLDVSNANDVVNSDDNRASSKVDRGSRRKRNKALAKEKKNSAADFVVRHLTPAYKKGLISSKDLFKEFARRLTHLLSDDKRVIPKNSEFIKYDYDLHVVSTFYSS